MQSSSLRRSSNILLLPAGGLFILLLILSQECCHSFAVAFCTISPLPPHRLLLPVGWGSRQQQQQQHRQKQTTRRQCFDRTSTTTTSVVAVAATATETVEPADPDYVFIYKDAETVGKEIRKIVKSSALQAIEERGYFALAIPGGSILKMLVSTCSDDADDDFLSGEWTTKTYIAYVNHKCVDMDDIQLSTHAKARQLFLDKWTGATTLVLDGTDNAQEEAAKYETKMKELSTDILPRMIPSGVPVFDLSLIGVGDDGHVGSLYPGRDEVLVGPNGPWVLPVEMKFPPSITLSLPVMAAARTVVVAACGVSDKYPQGKSDGMRRAISDPDETLQTFPAVGLRQFAKWIIDEAAASKLGEEYATTK